MNYVFGGYCISTVHITDHNHSDYNFLFDLEQMADSDSDWNLGDSIAEIKNAVQEVTEEN